MKCHEYKLPCNLAWLAKHNNIVSTICASLSRLASDSKNSSEITELVTLSLNREHCAIYPSLTDDITIQVIGNVDTVHGVMATLLKNDSKDPFAHNPPHDISTHNC